MTDEQNKRFVIYIGIVLCIILAFALGRTSASEVTYKSIKNDINRIGELYNKTTETYTRITNQLRTVSDGFGILTDELNGINQQLTEFNSDLDKRIQLLEDRNNKNSERLNEIAEGQRGDIELINQGREVLDRLEETIE